MKKSLLSLMLFITGLTYCQNSYIETNDGEKIIIKDQDYYYATFKKVRYFISDDSKNWTFQRGIEVTKVKELISGKKVYRIYNIEKKPNFYKIVATSATKTLLLNLYEPHDFNDHNHFYYFIIDNDNKIVEKGEFVDGKFERNMPDQLKAFKDIRTHFADCPDILSNLADYETRKPDRGMAGFTEDFIAGFMFQDNFLKCE